MRTFRASRSLLGRMGGVAKPGRITQSGVSGGCVWPPDPAGGYSAGREKEEKGECAINRLAEEEECPFAAAGVVCPAASGVTVGDGVTVGVASTAGPGLVALVVCGRLMASSSALMARIPNSPRGNWSSRCQAAPRSERAGVFLSSGPTGLAPGRPPGLSTCCSMLVGYLLAFPSTPSYLTVAPIVAPFTGAHNGSLVPGRMGGCVPLV